jgi:hypothetical protein
MNPGNRLVHNFRYFPEGHLSPYSQHDDLSQMRGKRLQNLLSEPGVDQIVAPGLEPASLPTEVPAIGLSALQAPYHADRTVSHHAKQPRSDIVGALALLQESDERILDYVFSLLAGTPLTGIEHQFGPVRLVPFCQLLLTYCRHVVLSYV